MTNFQLATTRSIWSSMEAWTEEILLDSTEALIKMTRVNWGKVIAKHFFCETCYSYFYQQADSNFQVWTNLCTSSFPLYGWAKLQVNFHCVTRQTNWWLCSLLKHAWRGKLKVLFTLLPIWVFGMRQLSFSQQRYIRFNRNLTTCYWILGIPLPKVCLLLFTLWFPELIPIDPWFSAVLGWTKPLLVGNCHDAAPGNIHGFHIGAHMGSHITGHMGAAGLAKPPAPFGLTGGKPTDGFIIGFIPTNEFIGIGMDIGTPIGMPMFIGICTGTGTGIGKGWKAGCWCCWTSFIRVGPPGTFWSLPKNGVIL